MLSQSVVPAGRPLRVHPGVIIGPMPGGEALGRRLKAKREQRIAVRAYEKARARGFEPGHELEDWLAAELEVDAGERSI